MYHILLVELGWQRPNLDYSMNTTIYKTFIRMEIE